jgi:hypothetical protein
MGLMVHTIEQARFKTEEGNLLQNGWWKFADGCIAIPVSVVPTLSSSSMKELIQGKQLLRPPWLSIFVIKLSSKSKAVCEKCSLCAQNNPRQGPTVPHSQVQNVGKTPLENLNMDFTEMLQAQGCKYL